jgi:hypothetical protein
MWLSVELPQPSLVTEIQFESMSQMPGGRGGRGAAGAPPAPNGAPATGAAAPAAGAAPPTAGAAPAPQAGARGGFGGGGGTPIVGYPRGYSVQVSTDGKTWSNPVAQGKGEGSRTTITFPPTRAKFVRITQTETVPDAPSWSVRNLRIYEAAPKNN